MFEELFELIVRQCVDVGLVQGQHLSVDGTFVEANAAKESRIPREQLAEAAKVHQSVRQYVKELEEQNPVEEPWRRKICSPVSASAKDEPPNRWAPTRPMGTGSSCSGWRIAASLRICEPATVSTERGVYSSVPSVSRTNRRMEQS